jgi:hypothetical protein
MKGAKQRLSPRVALKFLVVGTQSWTLVRREDEFSAIHSALAGQQGVSGIVPSRGRRR